MIYLYIILVILIILSILIYISKNCLKVTKYVVKSEKIPNSFNKFKIVHIGDVHGKLFGKNNEKFIKKVNDINPDIIIMSGDIIDDSCKDVEKYVEYFKELYIKYPTYYSIGNHERKLGYNKYKLYLSCLRNYGVTVIENGSCYLEKNSEKIKINFLKFRENMQPKNLTEEKEQNYITYMKEVLPNINTKEYNILISHDPENFKMYEKLKVDLIFSGHIHGGLIRFGKICLLSPRRKFFPKYSYGKNTLNTTTIITTSGVGNATIPIRLFNRPEIVEVILEK